MDPPPTRPDSETETAVAIVAIVDLYFSLILEMYILPRRIRELTSDDDDTDADADADADADGNCNILLATANVISLRSIRHSSYQIQHCTLNMVYVLVQILLLDQSQIFEDDGPHCDD